MACGLGHEDFNFFTYITLCITSDPMGRVNFDIGVMIWTNFEEVHNTMLYIKNLISRSCSLWQDCVSFRSAWNLFLWTIFVENDARMCYLKFCLKSLLGWKSFRWEGYIVSLGKVGGSTQMPAWSLKVHKIQEALFRVDFITFKHYR